MILTETFDFPYSSHPLVSEYHPRLFLSQKTTVVVPPTTHEADRAANRDYGASLKLLLR